MVTGWLPFCRESAGLEPRSDAEFQHPDSNLHCFWSARALGSCHSTVGSNETPELSSFRPWPRQVLAEAALLWSLWVGSRTTRILGRGPFFKLVSVYLTVDICV